MHEPGFDEHADFIKPVANLHLGMLVAIDEADRRQFLAKCWVAHSRLKMSLNEFEGSLQLLGMKVAFDREKRLKLVIAAQVAQLDECSKCRGGDDEKRADRGDGAPQLERHALREARTAIRPIRSRSSSQRRLLRSSSSHREGLARRAAPS